jgi:carboxypeptidase Taq
VSDELTALKQAMQVVEDLQAIGRLLAWDQSTYMPSRGALSRARHIALVERIAHERLTNPRVGELLDALEAVAGSWDYDSDEAGLLRAARRKYDRAAKLPTDFYQEFIRHTAESYQVWKRARRDDDFDRIRPYLEQTLKYSREWADYFQPYEHVADPLIERWEPGMRVSLVKQLFDQLKPRLLDLQGRILDKPALDRSVLEQDFPVAKQLDYADFLAARVGYDFERGRQDLTAHPFETRIAGDDVRITTRVTTNDLPESLLSTIHEAGHAMYEQAIDPAYDATPLGRGASAAVHESQSRLWENIVGRSRGFWNWAFDELQHRFPEQFADSNPGQIYAAVNAVQPSLIRTEADEVTYNLHVMIRFDLELKMLEGDLSIADLPEAWADRYQQDLGIRPPDFRNGVMQDAGRRISATASCRMCTGMPRRSAAPSRAIRLGTS